MLLHDPGMLDASSQTTTGSSSSKFWLTADVHVVANIHSMENPIYAQKSRRPHASGRSTNLCAIGGASVGLHAPLLEAENRSPCLQHELRTTNTPHTTAHADQINARTADQYRRSLPLCNISFVSSTTVAFVYNFPPRRPGWRNQRKRKPKSSLAGTRLARRSEPARTVS